MTAATRSSITSHTPGTIRSMKISVSLPEEDVRFLDEQGTNRSATLHEAVTLLRERQLAEQYAEAFREWSDSPDADLWDTASADGLSS
jgi:Arc/MetJ-type ribon-helix-helix transcriptional regulator